MQLHDRFDRYRRMSISSKGMTANTAAEEDEIVAAAMEGDAVKAAKLLREHISAMALLVLANFPQI